MPIYEYKCNKCKSIFSILQKIGSTEKDTACPDCGSKQVKKQMSGFSCSLSGGGSLSSSTPHKHTGGG